MKRRPIGVRKVDNTRRDHTPIAVEFENCVQSFNSLCSAMEANQLAWEAKYALIRECRGEFRAWGDDTGALKGSLDHALRKNSRMRDVTIELLEDMTGEVRSMLEVVQMTALPLLSPAVLPESTGQGYFDTQTDLGGSLQAMNISPTTTEDMLDNISETLRRLQRLAPSLEDPVPRDTFSEEGQPSDAQMDIDIVEHMFPAASPVIVRRLGRANWKRRQYLQKLRSDNPRMRNQRTYYSRDSALGTSIADTAEFAKTGPLAIPVAPVDYERPGESFRCSYCSHEIVVGDQIVNHGDWVQHVLSDLEPYICTSQSCLRSEKTYGAREEWFLHELENHRTPMVYFCQRCAQELPSETQFEEHLREKHNYHEDPGKVSIMASLCKRLSQQPWTDQDCPLCGALCATAESFSVHVAVHMDQLALTAIEESADSEPDPPATPSASTYSSNSSEYGGNRLGRLEAFVFEQAQNYPPLYQSLNQATTTSLQTVSGAKLGQDTDDAEFLAAETSQIKRNVRPSMGQRSASYSYLEKAQQLKNAAEERLAPATEIGRSRSAGGAWNGFDGISIGPETTGAQTRTAIRTMPPSRNRTFVGRLDDMFQIHEVLSKPGYTCIICGMGGLGKSALAVEYTYRFEPEYSYIFWVHAETPMVCADSYSQIAITCVGESSVHQEQDRLIMLGREFLEQLTKRWLLVFDNVDHWLDLQRFLPTNLLQTCGSVLVTTQNKDTSQISPSLKYTQVNLGGLSLEDCRKLLLGVDSLKGASNDLKSHAEYKLAGEIAKLAERLPLALSLIAGFVLVSDCTLSEFVDLWNERHKKMTSDKWTSESELTEADKAMEMVWNIGLRDVTTDSRKLLNILAFLDSDTIQKDVLVGEHDDQLLEMLHSSEISRHRRMIKELTRRRLISMDTRDGGDVLGIHRNLQRKILQELNQDPAERVRVFTQAFLLVRKRFPQASPIQVPEPEKWPICRKYLPHVLSLRKLYLGTVVEIEPSVKLARLFSDGGIDLWERGLTNEGLDLLGSAETILDELDCDENLLRANINVIISLLLQSSGLTRLSEARDRSVTALEIRQAHQKSPPPSGYTKIDEILLYNAWSDYGCILLQYNDIEKAEPIFQECFERYKAWDRPEVIPYEYAKFYHHMAFCKLYRRDFSAAVELAEAGLHWVEVATGPSAATNRWKFDLACLVLQKGDLLRALQLHQEVLDARLELHGKYGFLTLQSYYAVGAVQAYLGELVSAETSLRTALDLANMKKATYSDAAIARTQFHLSEIITQQRKNSREARELGQTARSILERPHPLNNLNRVLQEHELALFDHLQPVFDGRFTGMWILEYIGL